MFSRAPQRDVSRERIPTEIRPVRVLSKSVRGLIPGRAFPALSGAFTLERRFSKLDLRSPRPHERRHVIGASVRSS
jgi:hypothetical protein